MTVRAKPTQQAPSEAQRAGISPFVIRKKRGGLRSTADAGRIQRAAAPRCGADMVSYREPVGFGLAARW